MANFRGGDNATDLMGILCNTGLPPRLDILNSMRNVDHPSILRYIDRGVITWPQNNQQVYAFAPINVHWRTRLKNNNDERRISR